MPEEVVLIEYKSGRKWMSKDEWNASSIKHSPNVVCKAVYKKVKTIGVRKASYNKENN